MNGKEAMKQLLTITTLLLVLEINAMNTKEKVIVECYDDGFEKDKLVSDLKNWLKANRNSEDKEKVDAIHCFLANKNIF